MSADLSRRSSLSPPVRTRSRDPGARELDSDSDDHFSDAQSAQEDGAKSPIPRTRVEKVSDEPSYGEVPGTAAYKMREEDAEPDEIAMVQDPRSKQAAQDEERGGARTPRSPGGQPIPKTVLEESSGNSAAQSHPEIKHPADAAPDEVVYPLQWGSASAQSDDTSKDIARPPSSGLKSPGLIPARTRRKSSVSVASKGGGDEDDFGDDFDDFEAGGDDEDFGDFGDEFEQSAQSVVVAETPRPPAVQQLSFPIPDFDGMSPDELEAAVQPYLNALYPSASLSDDEDESTSKRRSTKLSSKDDPIFLTPRSASLWSQLVAPPPLQPPDWIRSRIRRLFLVSLGVPVDLDEILPASKQSKLILPSLHRTANTSSSTPRTSTDSARANSAAPSSRLRQQLSADGGNASSTSIDSAGGPRAGSKKKSTRKQPAPEPDFDLVAARQLCKTTDVALGGMTDDELRAHARRLKAMEEEAAEVLEHWRKRTDEQISERTAFEGVIENLVKHARKTRK